MVDQVCTDGPFEVDVKVYITNGNDTGVVTVGLAKGTFPTVDAVKLAVTQAQKAAKEAKMRLMNRHEFVSEFFDRDIAVPGPKEFT